MSSTDASTDMDNLDGPEHLPQEHVNGTTPKGTVCPERKQVGALHCWHTSGNPRPQPSGAVMFDSMCCFCAPTYMHMDILVPRNTPDESIVAEQMRHGHLVTIKRQPMRGPTIAVAGR